MDKSRKVAIVTGSNKGIGFHIVKLLCQKFDGYVYLTARNLERGKAAVEELEKQGLHPLFHVLDIESEKSIIAFRDYLKESHGGIDVLVNNAAIAYKMAATEPMSEQAEVSIRINFFGTYNVCEELFPLLRPHGRVVHISSSAGHLTRVTGKEPAATELRKRLASESLTESEICTMMKDYVRLVKEGKHFEAGWQNSTYSVSKVGLSALSRAQQRHFDQKHPEEDIVVNSCHPGYVDTDMTSHKGVMRPEDSAPMPVYLALLPPNVKEPRGAYIWSDKRIIDWVNGPVPDLV